jgi:NADH-quinone oxidoreductase subunit L
MTPIIAAFLITLLPLTAFAVQIFGGRRLPGQGWYVPTAAILTSLSLSLWLFFGQMLPANDPAWAIGLTWDFIRGGGFSMPLGVRVDNISVIMLIVVTTVSSMVHIFSTGYMADDPRKGRFFGFLGLFSFSMLWLVLSDNLLGIFCGWELVGLSSYLLIGFWFEKQGPPEAAMKAFITNRVGDLGFLCALMILMWRFGTFDLQELKSIVDGFGTGLPAELSLWMTLAGLGLFCGAVGKSAQFPLHIWLPDAMEGPTPVSALIHAATMVAAGVYLLVRVFFLLSFDVSLVIAYIGGFTALMSATIALTQWDIKRVLAYSTISQLGYMVLAVGVGAYSAGFLHLMTHAFFKACLFLGSGSVIHGMHHVYYHAHDHHRDPQDMRTMGGLRRKLPVTYWSFLVATLALTGIPLTSGFISKDAILAGSLAFAMEHPEHWPLAFFGFAAAMLTAFYMFRLVFLTFHGEYRGKPGEEAYLRENSWNMTGPLVVLSMLSAFFFYATSPTDASQGWFYRLVPQPAQPLQHAVAVHVGHLAHIHHQAHVTAMLISVIIVALSITAAWLTYLKRTVNPVKVAAALPRLHRFLFRKWYFDELYRATVIVLTLAMARLSAWFDRTVIDGLVNGSASVTIAKSRLVSRFDRKVVDGAVNGVGWQTRASGAGLRLLQGGDIQGYLVKAIVGVGLILIWQVL